MFKFDNSYSWTRSKEVFYSVKLFSPNEDPHAPTPPTPRSDHTPQSGADGNDEFFDCENQSPERVKRKPNDSGNQATEPVTTETVPIETEPVSRTLDTSNDANSDLGEGGVSTAPIEVSTSNKETSI